ncbi:cytochrome c oxidase assembly factor 1 homolog isoform X1 [Bos javanicus]|nr:cytochrome c oxidase assembly factor 1 homolog isoform X1 [Bos javanicus]
MLLSRAPGGECPGASLLDSGVLQKLPSWAAFLRWFSRKLGYEVAKSLGSRMSMPLGKQVFFAGVAASGSCAILYYLVQKMFSRASYYQLALEQLHSHPEALEALGTPLNVHYLRLTDKYNFVDIADAKLKIPVSGPKSEGHLYVSSSRDAPFKRWNLQEVFLELKDGQQIPLFKPSRDNDEVKKE